MLAAKAKSTAELVAEARQTYEKSEEAIANLDRVRREIAETISYIRWRRFLDYDPRTLEFLEKLDMKDCRTYQ